LAARDRNPSDPGLATVESLALAYVVESAPESVEPWQAGPVGEVSHA
jgi:hypothetical protein